MACENFEQFAEGVVLAFSHCSHKGYTNNPERVSMPNHDEFYVAGVILGSMMLKERGAVVFEDLPDEKRREMMQEWT